MTLFNADPYLSSDCESACPVPVARGIRALRALTARPSRQSGFYC